MRQERTNKKGVSPPCGTRGVEPPLCPGQKCQSQRRAVVLVSPPGVEGLGQVCQGSLGPWRNGFLGSRDDYEQGPGEQNQALPCRDLEG